MLLFTSFRLSTPSTRDRFEECKEILDCWAAEAVEWSEAVEKLSTKLGSSSSPIMILFSSRTESFETSGKKAAKEI